MITLLTAAALAAPGVTTRTVEHLGDRYHVVTVDLRLATVDLLGQGERARPRTFEALRATLGDDLLAATNAGIFHAPSEPVGLWIEQGALASPLSVADGAGNFFLKPNGVFWVDGAGAHVADAAGFEVPDGTRLATQSGPALLLDGAVHPKLDPASGSLKLRNAVGVSDPWTVHLVVSEGPVRFHDLATLFRDALRCDDALYLDGTISGLWAPGLPEVPEHVAYAGFLVVVPRLRDGDVVFQRSTSSQADAIALATGSEWTHTGVVRIVDEQPWVLEATSPVKLTPLQDWAARGEGGRFEVRRSSTPWTPEALARLDALQAEWLGRPYDAAFGWDDDALYCSELVEKVYERALGVELARRRRVDDYTIDDPALRRAMVARWGRIPSELRVVAPSDLFGSAALVPVP